MKYNLDLCFKGQRTYIQGGDIYNALTAILLEKLAYQNINKIDFSLHNMSAKSLYCELTSDFNKDEAQSILSFYENDTKHHLVVYESDKTIDSRYDYPEEEITKACGINPETKTIELKAKLRFTDIEIIVAMNKALLEKLFPESRGNWLFTRLQLNSLISKREAQDFNLELTHNLGGKLLKSKVRVDGLDAGFIYFSPKELAG